MSNSVFFSVIIPVYNVASYLTECLDSVLSQSYRNFEVILVDDGSTDSGGSICDEYAQKDRRIHVIHQNNSGLSAARNVGIALAVGDYILFLDSDDYWRDHSVLSILANRLEVRRAQVLSYNFAKFNTKKEYTPYFSSPSLSLESTNALSYITCHNLWIACAWNKAIERKLFHDNRLRFVEGIRYRQELCAN